MESYPHQPLLRHTAPPLGHRRLENGLFYPLFPRAASLPCLLFVTGLRVRRQASRRFTCSPPIGAPTESAIILADGLLRSFASSPSRPSESRTGLFPPVIAGAGRKRGESPRWGAGISRVAGDRPPPSSPAVNSTNFLWQDTESTNPSESWLWILPPLEDGVPQDSRGWAAGVAVSLGWPVEEFVYLYRIRGDTNFAAVVQPIPWRLAGSAAHAGEPRRDPSVPRLRCRDPCRSAYCNSCAAPGRRVRQLSSRHPVRLQRIRESRVSASRSPGSLFADVKGFDGYV